MNWGKARKKPIIVQYREVKPDHFDFRALSCERVQTLEGELLAYPDRDYIIKGVRDETYPIGKDIFNETYDVIEEFCEKEDTQ